MNHSYIDDHQVAELYLQGRLSPEEAARFEEHSMSCPECLDRLETAEKLRLGLRAVAAREIAAETVKLGLLARLMRSRLAPLAFTALLAIAVLPAGLLWRRAGRLEGELVQTREQLREERNRPVPTPIPTPDLEADALRGRLEAEREEKERLAAELEKAGEPRGNVPVVPLSPERSAPGSEPTTRISLSSSPELLVLLLELDATDFPGYRATVSGGGTVWHLAHLRTDAQGSLTLALPAARLKPGNFTIRVEGVPAQGRPASVAEFSFRVVR